MKTTLIKAGLDAIYFSGGHMAMRPFCRGIGAILTMHHVVPKKKARFAPNNILEITPEFLARVIKMVRRKGYDIVSLDEAHRRIVAPDAQKPFVCLTFDDGYRDNLEIAYPILRRNDAPFAIYVATSYPDRVGELWWLALEEIISKCDYIGVRMDSEQHHLSCRTLAEKHEVWGKIYWWMRNLPQKEQRQVIRDLCARYDVDLVAMCEKMIMSWDEIHKLARDPLVTIGAHTVNHFAIAKLSAADAKAEMITSAEIISSYIGERPKHFSFPYGDPGSAGPRDFEIAKEVGFLTAVTTRKGVIHKEYADHMTALPRISLNGNYQSLRYLDVFLGGTAFSLKNRMRHLDIA